MGNQESAQGTPYTSGFHVVKVKPGSPGDQAGLVPFFDYIVEANGTLLDQQNNQFVQILHSNVDKAVPTVIYNSKTETSREATITPNSAWDPNKKELLGVSIRFCNIKNSTEYVWHVLEVYPNSPASAAGLQPFSDYVVGCSSLVFQSSEDFFNLVASNLGRQLEFFVYNSETDLIRMVTLTPNKEWGGVGSLGCNVAYGLLHKIPTQRSSTREEVEPELPKPQALPLAVQDSLPSPGDVEIKEITPQFRSTVSDTPVVASPVPMMNPLTTAPSPRLVAPTTAERVPQPVLPRVPVNIAASAPNVVAPFTPPQRLPQSESVAQVAVTSPSNSNLDALKQKQLALQQQLQKLRESQKRS